MGRILAITAVLTLLLAAGCYDFNNPVDPAASNYQGYPSEPPVVPTTPPSGPLALNVGAIGITDREHQIKLNWTDTADDEAGFQVQRKVAPGAYVTIATLPPDSALYIDTSASGDTTYTFCVLAYNAAGSTPSVEVTWTTAPIAPSSLYVYPDAADLSIDWVDNSATEDGYRIEHCTDGVSWAEITTVAANVTTYHHTALPEGLHYYRVRAYSATTGNSTYSNEVSLEL